MDKLADCMKKGLLKKVYPQIDLAKKDLQQAEFFLKEADELIGRDKKVMGAIALYNSFFHCSRSLLFKDGIKERSHYCIARYIEKEYVDNNKLLTKFLNGFETIMSIRHTAQYSTEEITIDEDLNELYSVCQEFIQAIGELLK